MSQPRLVRTATPPLPSPLIPSHLIPISSDPHLYLPTVEGGVRRALPPVVRGGLSSFCCRGARGSLVGDAVRCGGRRLMKQH
jgi:hypothetical protein